MKNDKKQAQKGIIKQFLWILIIGVTLIIAGTILYSAVDKILGWIIGIIGGIFDIIAFGCLFGDSGRVSRSYCHCGHKYNYNADISWEIITEKQKGDIVEDEVEITCFCPVCKYTYKIREKFVVAEYSRMNYGWKEKNINVLIREYFYL